MKKILCVCVVLAMTVLCCTTGCTAVSGEKSTYNITCEYLDSGVIGGRLSLDYCCALPNGTSVIDCNLFANAFRQNAEITPLSGAEKQYGGIDILSVSSGGKSLEYSICGTDKNILSIFLGRLIGKGEEVNVIIEFAVLLPSGNYRFCKGENTVNLGNWYPTVCAQIGGGFYRCEYYPVGDPFVTDVADFNLQITVPSQMVVASSGKCKTTEVFGEKTTYTFGAESVRDFALVLSPKFMVAEKKLGNIAVNYYYYNDQAPEKTLDLTCDALNFFSQNFGDYPFETFSVCQTNFDEGGMEYSGLVYVNDTLNELNHAYTVVHETAHQWWYGMVGNNQLEEAFLDEGLTEYSTAVFFDERPCYNVSGKKVFDNALRSVKGYAEVVESLGTEVNYSLKRHLSNFSGEAEYVVMAYDMPLVMMKTIEDNIGRKRMLACLRKYFNNNKNSIATYSDLAGVFGAQNKVLQSFVAGNISL